MFPWGSVLFISSSVLRDVSINWRKCCISSELLIKSEGLANFSRDVVVQGWLPGLSCSKGGEHYPLDKLISSR